MDDIARERSYPTPLANSPWLPLVLLSLTVVLPRTKTTFKDSYDYIIVGGGTAGSVVAKRLSELPCVKVLVLERGKMPPKISFIPSFSPILINSDLNSHYNTTPQKHTGRALHNRKMYLIAGNVLGGSGSTNGMVYIRLPQDYDYWAQQGATGWDYNNVLPYFKKFENNRNYLHADYYGHKGPIFIERPRYESIERETWKNAIHEMGETIVDVNGPIGGGFCDMQSTARNGERFSTLRGYLQPASMQDNVDILTEAPVTKVLFENNRAIGVCFEYRGRTYEVKATREVILSAGTLGTPKILMLSGVGPRDHLESLNIDVVKDVPAVGNNLQDHTFSGLYYEVDQRIPSDDEKYKDDRTYDEYVKHHTGFLTTVFGVSYMASLRHDPKKKVPDYGLYLTHTLKNPLEGIAGPIKKKFSEQIFGPYKNKTIIGCMPFAIKQRSRGSIRLASNNFNDPPLIDLNFLEHPQDVTDLVNAYKKCKEFGETEAFKKIGAKMFKTLYPGCEQYDGDDDKYYACVVRTLIVGQHHYSSTCRMGQPSDPTTVVDPELRVKGLRNLRVVDASVMPTVTLGNTMAPTIMIGEKGSDLIKSGVKCSKGI